MCFQIDLYSIILIKMAMCEYVSDSTVFLLHEALCSCANLVSLSSWLFLSVFSLTLAFCSCKILIKVGLVQYDKFIANRYSLFSNVNNNSPLCDN